MSAFVDQTLVPHLSAIVITRNEAANIGGCLDSLAFCDERIVVDSGSTDGTVLVVREKVVGYDVVEAYGGAVVLVDLVPGHSTTNMVARSGGQPKTGT